MTQNFLDRGKVLSLILLKSVVKAHRSKWMQWQKWEMMRHFFTLCHANMSKNSNFNSSRSTSFHKFPNRENARKTLKTQKAFFFLLFPYQTKKLKYAMFHKLYNNPIKSGANRKKRQSQRRATIVSGEKFQDEILTAFPFMLPAWAFKADEIVLAPKFFLFFSIVWRRKWQQIERKRR